MTRAYTRRPWSRRRGQTLAERFWEKVDKTEECWLWKASTDRGGYGSIAVSQGVYGAAHRVSWELAYGPIQPGLFVLHRCDTPACVRPSHLWLGTNAENLADAATKGRMKAGTSRGPATPPSIVAEILARHAAGESGRSLARAYGLSTSAVSLYVRGKRRQG